METIKKWWKLSKNCGNYFKFPTVGGNYQVLVESIVD
jgi:hypothetical protein